MPRLRFKLTLAFFLAYLVSVCTCQHWRSLSSDGFAASNSGSNSTLQERLEQGENDATWVLTSSFVVLTMQCGFGLLESGSIEDKFAVNVMMKNVADILFGGLSYWMVGYGISYGESAHGVLGTSNFFLAQKESLYVSSSSSQTGVDQYSHYIFQFTFAATATTIVSGCVAGRMRFIVYIVFSFVNTAQYGVPAHWVFSEHGWLFKLGFHDFAGDSAVHMLGGITGGVAAWMVGPREGRFEKARASEFQPANPVNCIFGLFILWWGWLGFNCGSTFGITGYKWLVATRVAVTTMNSSLAGGIFGMCISAYCNKGKVKVDDTVNGILASLVAITGACAVVSPTSALLIGIIGAALAQLANKALLHYHVLDDPVGAVGVHAAAGTWGVVAVGLFADASLVGSINRSGLFLGGGFRQLGVQVLGIVVVTCWTLLSSSLLFGTLQRVLGLRVRNEVNIVGADLEEHGVETKQIPPGSLTLSDFSSKDLSACGVLPHHIEMLLRMETRQWLAEHFDNTGAQSLSWQPPMSGTNTAVVVGVPSLSLPTLLPDLTAATSTKAVASAVVSA